MSAVAETKKGYVVQTTDVGLAIHPYSALENRLVLEYRSKKDSPRAHIRLTKPQQRGSLSSENVLFNGRGDLHSEKFRKKIVEAAGEKVDPPEGEPSFDERLSDIAVVLPEEFEKRKGDLKSARGKEDPESRQIGGTDYWVYPGQAFKKEIPVESDDPRRVSLTNWTGRIIRDTIIDNEAELERSFTLEIEFRNKNYIFDVCAAEFESLRWLATNVVARAVYFPNQRDHARVCLQLASEDLEVSHVYAHTGWREIDGEWGYLHAGGAIFEASNEAVGSILEEDWQYSEDDWQHSDNGNGDRYQEKYVVGSIGSISESRAVRLSGNQRYRVLTVPETKEEEREAIKAAFRVLEVGPLRITAAPVAGVWHAPITTSRHSQFLVGKTGALHTALAAVLQQHFGPEMDETQMLSWESTANSLELDLYALKNQLCVIDEYVPSASKNGSQMERTARRIFQEKANQSSRGRLYADLTQRADKPPRAYVLATGEEIPAGSGTQSVRGRIFITEMGRPNGEPELDKGKLLEMQKQAKAGVLATAMGGYVRWLAGFGKDLDDIAKRLTVEFRTRTADFAVPKQHPRMTETTAELCVGVYFFLRYAAESGAITQEDADDEWEGITGSIFESAVLQSHHQSDADPVERFISLLGSALSNGDAHIIDAESDTGYPIVTKYGDGGAWGWRQSGNEYSMGDPGGKTIGYLFEDTLWLDPEASLRAAGGASTAAEPWQRT